MLGILAVGILAVTGVIIAAVQVWRPSFGYAWLIAAAGSLAGWIFALAARLQLPRNLALADWQPRVLLPVTPALTLDALSWTLLVGILSLNLASVSTDVLRSASGERPGARWIDLIAGLFICSLSGLAVLSGNLVTLLLLWSAADLALLVIWMLHAATARETEIVVLATSLRLAANAFMIWAAIRTSTAGVPSALTALSPSVSWLLLAAASLRLGLLPPHRPTPQLHSLSPGLSTLTWLAGSAPTWLLLARAASAVQLELEAVYLLIACVGLAYAVLSWLTAASAQEGLPFWTLAISALALSSAARGLPFAALAWGAAGLMIGGLLGLAETRTRLVISLLVLSAAALSTLPFTPTWAAVQLYQAPYSLFQPVLLIGQAGLLIGFVRLIGPPVPPRPTAERWVWLIYPLGLAVLPAALIYAWFQVRPGTTGGLPAWPGWLESGITIIGLGFTIALAAYYLRSRYRINFPRVQQLFELPALYQSGWNLYRRLGKLARFLNWALEGRSGLLWTLLLLALLISLLIQVGLGAAR